jgi:CRISPR-associated protein Csd1
MILQSLAQLYDRLAEDPSHGLPKTGYSLQNISFRIVLNLDGSLAGEIQDARNHETITDKKGKQKTTAHSTAIMVPGQTKSSGSGLNPCFLWDNPAYMLGYKPEDGKPDRTYKAFTAFKKHHLDLEPVLQNEEFSAVCRFLETWNPDQAKNQPIFKDIKTGFGVFQLTGKTRYVHQHPDIRTWWDKQIAQKSEGKPSICLITGQTAPLATLHDPAIKGVIGAQSSGAKLVSFNLNAFSSHAKEQGQNSPISKSAAFAYCKALNFLLADPKRRFRIGDSTCVFWTDQPKPTPAEEVIPFLISPFKEEEDEGLKQRLQSISEKLSRGQLSGDDLGGAQTTFYLLGLSPNASRLSIRFWHTSTLGDLATNLKKHFDDLRIIRGWEESNSDKLGPETPSAFQLLQQTARKDKEISPLLSGALMRAILLGTRYPETLYTSVLRRIKADRNVNYLKASILKAYLIRNHGVPMTKKLDLNNPPTDNPAYHLGRLFALYETAQRHYHNWKLNRTIRETMYASASATPILVFGRLEKLFHHHTREKKYPKKSQKTYNQIAIDIFAFFPAKNPPYPSSLNLMEQSLFAVGYYHMQRELNPFTEKETSTEPSKE